MQKSTFLKSFTPLRYFTTTQSKEAKFYHLLLLGAPGVGKGTYSKLIEKQFNFGVFSMGEYFRSLINNEDAIKSQSSQANKDFLIGLKNTLRSGKLVDDETVLNVVKTINKEQQEYSDKHG